MTTSDDKPTLNYVSTAFEFSRNDRNPIAANQIKPAIDKVFSFDKVSRLSAHGFGNAFRICELHRPCRSFFGLRAAGGGHPKNASHATDWVDAAKT